MGKSLKVILCLKSFAVSVFLLSLSLPVSAKIDSGTLYSYEKRIWSEAFNSRSDIAMMADAVLEAFIRELKKTDGFYRNTDTIDLKSIVTYRKKVRAIIRSLNIYMDEERADANDGHQWADTLPDAMVVYLGPSVIKSLVFGVAASVRIGLVIIPQRVKKIENATGEVVDTYYTVDVAPIGWPQIGFAFGPGLGASVMGGVAFLWNTRGDIESATDIKSCLGIDGEIAASSVVAGGSISAGMLYNFASNSLNPYIYYLEGEISGGPKVEANIRVNGQLLVAPTSIYKWLASVQNRSMREFEKGLEEKIRKRIKEHHGEVDRENYSPDIDSADLSNLITEQNGD